MNASRKKKIGKSKIKKYENWKQKKQSKDNGIKNWFLEKKLIALIYF